MKRRLVGHDYTRRGIYLLTMAVEGRRPRQTPSGSHPEHGLLFEPGYNDLLLRNSEEYQRWKHYLRDNPRRLLMKRERPELLRPFFNMTLGTHTYNGIGNRELLKAPKRLAVRVSRRLVGKALEGGVRQHR